jgi:hypothetical protein
VRTVAEGLLGGLAAGTPVLGFARFEIDTDGGTRRNEWISHVLCHSRDGQGLQIRLPDAQP